MLLRSEAGQYAQQLSRRLVRVVAVVWIVVRVRQLRRLVGNVPERHAVVGGRLLHRPAAQHRGEDARPSRRRADRLRGEQAGCEDRHADEDQLPLRPGQGGEGQAGSVPQVEISVSLYSTEQQATDRVSGTVSEWRDHGASQTDAQVDKDAAVLLTGYGTPLLVVAHAERTVAVSVAPALLKGQNMATVMGALAGQAISNS